MAQYKHELVILLGIVNLVYVWLRKINQVEQLEQQCWLLTWRSVMRILTSFITCPTSCSLLVLMLLQATCRCFIGSRARCTVAKEPVPRHCEVTIYPPMRFLNIRNVWDINRNEIPSELAAMAG
jgi:hypothetical protein